MNAASPVIEAFSASHSLYPTTLGGEIEPTQRAALFHARIACVLFTLIVLSSSMMRPPPSEACHSSALQVKPSPAPCHTNPQKSLLPLVLSPPYIPPPILPPSSQVLSCPPYPYCRKRPVR